MYNEGMIWKDQGFHHLGRKSHTHTLSALPGMVPTLRTHASDTTALEHFWMVPKLFWWEGSDELYCSFIAGDSPSLIDILRYAFADLVDTGCNPKTGTAFIQVSFTYWRKWRAHWEPEDGMVHLASGLPLGAMQAIRPGVASGKIPPMFDICFNLHFTNSRRNELFSSYLVKSLKNMKKRKPSGAWNLCQCTLSKPILEENPKDSKDLCGGAYYHIVA